MGRKHLLVLGGSGAALFASAPLQAQGPGTDTVPGQPGSEQSADEDRGDIIVTARRVEERLIDVPVTVSALTGQDLARQAVDDLVDVAEKTVGFAYEQLSGLIVQPSIRGQTNLRVDSPVQNVAFYLDGLYLQRGYLVDQNLLELQRVEVIKGPQSALYGRNAFAGAVNMVTVEPDLDELHAKLSGTIGSDERYDGRASLSVPIIPGKLAIFVAFAHSQFDGTWENNFPENSRPGSITQGNLGGYNKETYQGRIVFKPIDELTFDALYIRTERLIEAGATYTIGTTGTFNSLNTLNASPKAFPPFSPLQNRLFVGRIPAEAIFSPLDVTRPEGLVIDPRSFGLRGPTDVASGKIRFEPEGPITATYQFGYTNARVEGRGSVSNNPLTPVIIPGFGNLGAVFDASGSGSSFRSYSHELRFDYDADGPVRALFGLNYADTRDVASNISEGAPVAQPGQPLQPPNPNAAFPIGPGLPFPSGLLQRFGFLERNEDIFSIFGFVGIDFSEQFEVTAEARYTLEDQGLVDRLTRDPLNPTIQNRNPPRFRRESKYITPRFTATYKFTPDNNIYASVARGVKAGGLNGNTPFVGQREYQDETNWTYEIGAKNRFLDGRLNLNLSAFYTDWQNLQTSVVRLTAAGVAPGFAFVVPSTVGNVGGVDVYGVEAEGSFRFADPLTFSFGASYNRARYKDGVVSQRFGASNNCDGVVCTTVPGTPTPVLPIGGNQLERVPEFDGYAALIFEQDFGDWDVFARVDGTYQTKQYIDEANLAFVPDRFLMNASAGVTFGTVNVQAWVKNLLDKEYVSTAFFLIGTGGAGTATYTPVLGDKRSFGLTATISY